MKRKRKVNQHTPNNTFKKKNPLSRGKKATTVNNKNQNILLLFQKMGNDILYYYYYFRENNMVQDLCQKSGRKNSSYCKNDQGKILDKIILIKNRNTISIRKNITIIGT